MSNIIANHLKKVFHGLPVKNIEASVQFASRNLQQAATHVLNFYSEQNAQNFKKLKADQIYWQSFLSDWVADIELKCAVLSLMNKKKALVLQVHIPYLKQLAANPDAMPENKAAPKKKPKGEAPLALKQPPRMMH
ncbi:MAG: hypothetical protein ACI9TY_000103 [Alphaproteobacteria bacterium]|jgi:hypothetical protein